MLLLLLVAAPARAAEPFCDALGGLGGAAEALRRGEPAAAIPLARAARAALRRGRPGTQAATLLGVALLLDGRTAEAGEPLEAALGSAATDLDPALRLVVERARQAAAGSRVAPPDQHGADQPPSGAERLVLAGAALQQGRAAAALAEAELAAGATPPAPAGQAALLQGLALAAMGRFEEATELVRPLAEDVDPGLRRGARWLQARAAARAGRTEEATARYASVAGSQALVPGLGERRSRELGDESAYLAAWLWYDAGQFSRAIARLDRFSRDHPGSPRAEDARWFAAWATFRAGDRRGALLRLARLESGPLADAALYWNGRLGGSRERLRRAALAGGDGWYGWLARRRLEQLHAAIPSAPVVALPVAGRPGQASLARLSESVALLAAGWREAALQELEALAHRGADRATVVEICRLASFSGEPALAYRVARDQLGQAPPSQRWLYPAAFEEQVTAAARGAGLDEALLLAVIRRESNFRPEARSLAGAIGLGQLLPRTAERLATVAGLDAEAAARLGDPTTNLHLAALYLGLLRDRFGNDAAAVAAYNAGPTALSGWSRAGPPTQLDEWVENVPYKETRTYLKAVLAAREVYRRLEGLPPLLDPAAPVGPAGLGVSF